MSEQSPQPERPTPNEAQETTLRILCGHYKVEYSTAHYLVYEHGSWMTPGWAEGWIGGEPGTLFVGVDPEGQAHS